MFVEIVKNVGSVIGVILSSITLITLFCKPLRKKLVGWIQKTSHSPQTQEAIEEIRNLLREHIENDSVKQEQMELFKETMVGLLRNEITSMYYKYMKEKTIPARAKENLTHLFSLYERCGGNSYISSIYKEMMQLPIADLQK